jgi:hypothetical protein
VSPAEIQAFRHQVQGIDMVGCDQPEAVHTRIAALAQGVTRGCYAQGRECTVCSKGYRCSVTSLIPQGCPRRVS